MKEPNIISLLRYLDENGPATTEEVKKNVGEAEALALKRLNEKQGENDGKT